MTLCCGVKSRIATLFADASTADVTFVVGSEKVHIPAHAAVVSTSDCFKAMFYGGFNCERVVEVPDASPDGFRAIIKYVYTDEADLTEVNAESVLSLADKYLLTDLRRDCIDWLKEHVNASNVCRFLPLAELYNDLSTLWKIVLDDGDAVLNSACFLSLPKDLVAKLLVLDGFVVEERVIYARTIEWAKRQLETNGYPTDAAGIRATLGEVLYLIRFPLLDAKDFASGPAVSGILSQEECLSLFHWFVAQTPPSLFRTEARRGRTLTNIDELTEYFALHRGRTCEHEGKTEIDGSAFRCLCKTATLNCAHVGQPGYANDVWICLACCRISCGYSAGADSCGLHRHCQLTQHALFFNVTSSDVFCIVHGSYLTQKKPATTDA